MFPGERTQEVENEWTSLVRRLRGRKVLVAGDMIADVYLDGFPAPGKAAGTGTGSSKKAAELAAASAALDAIRSSPSDA